MIYRLAKNVELVEREDGAFLVSKAPLSLLRLNAPLAELARCCLSKGVSPASATESAVLEQLVVKGFAEWVRNPAALETDIPTVSVVIPVKDRAEELRRCLASIAAVEFPSCKLEVIVVDDGSSDDSAEAARDLGAVVVHSGGIGRGPASARNVGARHARGEILAFIDSDCTASINWLAELLPAFADPGTAAVGGLVDGMCTDSVVDRYEVAMSSLSLGARERTGGRGNDTFYLPSCNLLIRRTAFWSVGGFNDSMHVGEDVDLTWRLRDQGWTISYLPAGKVFHKHRSTVRSFMSRRFDYGTSEGILQRLHPERRKQMVIPPLLAFVLALCVLAPFTGWWPLAVVAGVLAADGMAVRARMTRRGIPIRLASVISSRLRATGSLAYYLCHHAVRYYSLPLICVSLFFPLVWPAYLAALGCAAWVDFCVKKPPQGFAPFAAVYTLEQLSYGSGVFWGCLRMRSFSSYRIVLNRQMEQPA